MMTTYQQRFYKRIGLEYNSSTTMVLYNQPLATPVPVMNLQLQELSEA